MGGGVALYSRKDRQNSVLVLHFSFTSYSHIRHHTENLRCFSEIVFVCAYEFISQKN